MNNNTIDVGLDFGGRHIRAAYRSRDYIISVPAPPSEAFWHPPIITLGHPSGGVAISVLKLLFYTEEMIQWGPKLHQQKAQTIVSDILENVYDSIYTYAGYEIGRLFITIPDWYPIIGRDRLKMATQRAGFDETYLISECQAAAIGYLEDYQHQEKKKIIIYSLGFTGFEAQIIEVGAGQMPRVLAQHSENIQGEGPDAVFSGKDLDLHLLHVALSTAQRYGLQFDLGNLQMYWSHLHRMVEQVKMSLSVDYEAVIEFPPELSQGNPIQMQFPRMVLEQVLYPKVIDPSTHIVQSLMNSINLTPDDIYHILLVGGTTRIPAIQQSLTQIFGDKLVQPREDIIARGAASIDFFTDQEEPDFSRLLNLHQDLSPLQQTDPKFDSANHALTSIEIPEPDVHEDDLKEVTDAKDSIVKAKSLAEEDTAEDLPRPSDESESKSTNILLEQQTLTEQVQANYNQNLNDRKADKNNETTPLSALRHKVEAQIEQGNYDDAQKLLREADQEISQLHEHLQQVMASDS